MPTRAFAEIAERYGVDPRDLDAIEKWFCESLPLLPGHDIEEILETLLSWPEGQPATFGDHHDDAEEAPSPGSTTARRVRFPCWRADAGISRGGC